MLICIICRSIVKYNGKKKSFTICPKCKLNALTKEQENILKRNNKNNEFLISPKKEM